MILAIDFEYKKSNELILDLIAVSYSLDNAQPVSLWLHNDDEAKQALKSFLLGLREHSCKIMCFNASAESHAFISLNINPLKYDWIDLQQEWKMITNHCDLFRYGEQLIDGKEVTTTRKNYFGAIRKEYNHSLPNLSLLACTYKLLGIKEDYEYKEKMRKLILESETYSDNDKKEILSYCSGDIQNLFKLKDEFMSIYRKLPTSNYSIGTLAQEILLRGKNSVRSGVIESSGIPVNTKRVKNLSSKVQTILDECAKEITELFPDIKPFEWDKKNNRYKKNVKLIQKFIEKSAYVDKWDRTDKNAISLSLDAFTNLFSFRHHYPKDNFFAQMIRYLRLSQSFNGLKPKLGEESFFDSLGSDNRIRPFFNIYRAQSSRYQPKAKTFPFLWASWIRAVVESPDKILIGIDYASQEFLISALLSEDEKMIEAYRSGDPYLYIGKQAGAIPQDGTKESHKKERNIFKWVTLGISYAMTKVGLSRQLTTQLGQDFSEEEAENLINLFFRVFPKYKLYTELIQKKYRVQRCIKLPDGWYMFGDNDNIRSVGNMPIQGTGACILRKAIELCQDNKLSVIFPLHDALYIEIDKENYLEKIDLFFKLMKEAFLFYFEDKVSASLIRFDCVAWAKFLNCNTVTTSNGNQVVTKNIYIDDRGKSEYEVFSKYFED